MKMLRQWWYGCCENSDNMIMLILWWYWCKSNAGALLLMILWWCWCCDYGNTMMMVILWRWWCCDDADAVGFADDVMTTMLWGCWRCDDATVSDMNKSATQKSAGFSAIFRDVLSCWSSSQKSCLTRKRWKSCNQSTRASQKKTQLKLKKLLLVLQRCQKVFLRY